MFKSAFISPPPETTKTYEGPQYTDGTSKWINFDTMIYLDATDDVGPHDSGVAATYWRDQIVDNMNCEEPETSCFPIHVHEDAGWNLYTAPFNKDEESCHMIEYYSVDNVDKKEDVKAQCVFVDNTPPNVEKVISSPKEPWEGDDTFYPGLKARCAAGEIECWKITMGTQLSLGCNDPEPHPVDDETMCFQIELDGDDVTEDYCDYYDDQYDVEMDGDWCCGEEIDEFYFGEESQHDLKVKCIDALGNEGPVDEEKFKVEGCDFDIPLYKKWNLISVPFTLLNGDPEAVITLNQVGDTGY